MIRLPASCSIAKASNAMTSLLASTANSLDLFNQILNVVTHPGSRPTFADQISRMIGCPVALVDDSFNTLSAAPGDLPEEEWLSFLSQKQRMVTHLPQKYNYEGFSLAPLSQLQGRYAYEVLFPLYADNTTKDLEGAIYFLSPDLVLPTNYSEILHYTAHALSWVLWKHVRQSQGSHATLNHPLVMTLVEMLYGGTPDDEKIAQVLSTCTYNVNRDFVLLVVESSAALSTEINPESVANALIGLFPEALTLCFSGDVVTLLPAFYLQDESYKDLWGKFSAYLAEIQSFAGLSTVFHSVDKYFLHHYIRAMSAARIARETLMEEHYSTYDENPIFNILADGIPPSNLIGLCDPNLLELIEHDKAGFSDVDFAIISQYLFVGFDIEDLTDYPIDRFGLDDLRYLAFHDQWEFFNDRRIDSFAFYRMIAGPFKLVIYSVAGNDAEVVCHIDMVSVS